jgi:hypothetical protein
VEGADHATIRQRAAIQRRKGVRTAALGCIKFIAEPIEHDARAIHLIFGHRVRRNIVDLTYFEHDPLSLCLRTYITSRTVTL